jgi:hypothetical protein
VTISEIRYYDIQLQLKNCTPDCDQLREAAWRSVAMLNYFGLQGHNLPERKINALLDIKKFQGYEAYLNACKGISKAAIIRNAKKAARNGIICRTFSYRQWSQDVLEVNSSLPTRHGKPLPAYYHQLEYDYWVDSQPSNPEEICCPLHYVLWWGAFISDSNAQKEERLIGYIRFERIGSIGIYSKILGHGDFLKLGTMFSLHLNICQWLFSKSNVTTGIDCILYSKWDSGGDGGGLQRWKKKCLFEPAFPVIVDCQEWFPIIRQ